MQKWKWIVDLSDEQRRELRSLVHKGKTSARRITRARVLLLAAEDRTDDEVAAALLAQLRARTVRVDPEALQSWRREAVVQFHTRRILESLRRDG